MSHKQNKNQQNKFNTVRYHFAFVPNMHNNVERHTQVKYGSCWTPTHILPHKDNLYSKWGNNKQWTMTESLTTVYILLSQHFSHGFVFTFW